MDQPAQTHQPPHIEQAKPTVQKQPLFSLIKKHFWLIVIFFVIAITSGVVMADHEAKSTANWKTFTSKEAGISFKHPEAFKVIEDKGWRITVYLSEQMPENNIKILYSHKDSTVNESAEEQFLANCQPAKVSEINANNTRIKVYEDSTCSGQTVENSVIVYSENGMIYDIGLFGKTDRDKLYQFLSTFRFENIPANEPPMKTSDSTDNWKTYTNAQYNFSIEHPSNFEVCSNCGMAGPFSTSDSVVSLATLKDQTDGIVQHFDGFAFFVEPNKENLTFREFVDKEQEENTEAYGEKLKEQTIIIGGNEGIYLEGKAFAVDSYAVPFPNSNNFLIISIAGEDKFKQQFQTMLSSFKFIDQKDPTRTTPTSPSICTMDAMICPDGTTVGRTGPKCEFVCPK